MQLLLKMAQVVPSEYHGRLSCYEAIFSGIYLRDNVWIRAKDEFVLYWTKRLVKLHLLGADEVGIYNLAAPDCSQAHAVKFNDHHPRQDCLLHVVVRPISPDWTIDENSPPEYSLTFFGQSHRPELQHREVGGSVKRT